MMSNIRERGMEEEMKVGRQGRWRKELASWKSERVCDLEV